MGESGEVLRSEIELTDVDRVADSGLLAHPSCGLDGLYDREHIVVTS